MLINPNRNSKRVHCRTGSLEKPTGVKIMKLEVHCRTGSLEICNVFFNIANFVHCRTGSLES